MSRNDSNTSLLELKPKTVGLPVIYSFMSIVCLQNNYRARKARKKYDRLVRLKRIAMKNLAHLYLWCGKSSFNVFLFL